MKWTCTCGSQCVSLCSYGEDGVLSHVQVGVLIVYKISGLVHLFKVTDKVVFFNEIHVHVL